ncbi:helix-turn-helix domain-containing protein [Lactobacillus amylovorus]|uniref:helix-turn-helix domain-containing protein n=1 Tax=Lactobacillus amylovorus TaxID=1604 RepID=UPI00232B92D7|nr:helix-turn-helix domain-containing protein [Lactobacillus amylovorus]MDB6250638.1 helix-turn-helix domain-containing protein [Lactobacillus amylovorus]
MNEKEVYLKIPLSLITSFDLTPRAILVYGELSGLYSKTKACFISDRTLASRLNCKVPTIQRAIKQLKDRGLIESKHLYNRRQIAVHTPNALTKEYILIPLTVIRNPNILLRASLLYGILNRKYKIQHKIEKDVYKIETDSPILTTKQELASKLDVSLEMVRQYLNNLQANSLIERTINKGTGLEIRLCKTLCKKIPKSENPTLDNQTHQENDHRPTKKMIITNLEPTKIMIIDPPRKRSSNKTLNRLISNRELVYSLSNKDISCLKNRIPNENDIPPEKVEESIPKEIELLNELDRMK